MPPQLCRRTVGQRRQRVPMARKRSTPTPQPPSNQLPARPQHLGRLCEKPALMNHHSDQVFQRTLPRAPQLSAHRMHMAPTARIAARTSRRHRSNIHVIGQPDEFWPMPHDQLAARRSTTREAACNCLAGDSLSPSGHHVSRHRRPRNNRRCRHLSAFLTFTRHLLHHPQPRRPLVSACRRRSGHSLSRLRVAPSPLRLLIPLQPLGRLVRRARRYRLCMRLRLHRRRASRHAKAASCLLSAPSTTILLPRARPGHEPPVRHRSHPAIAQPSRDTLPPARHAAILLLIVRLRGLHFSTVRHRRRLCPRRRCFAGHGAR